MIQKLDSEIGILTYCTDFKGVGGRIKETPGDFQVSEVILDKIKKSISEKGDYAVYKLKKKNIGIFIFP